MHIMNWLWSSCGGFVLHVTMMLATALYTDRRGQEAHSSVNTIASYLLKRMSEIVSSVLSVYIIIVYSMCVSVLSPHTPDIIRKKSEHRFCSIRCNSIKPEDIISWLACVSWSHTLNNNLQITRALSCFNAWRSCSCQLYTIAIIRSRWPRYASRNLSSVATSGTR